MALAPILLLLAALCRVDGATYPEVWMLQVQQEGDNVVSYMDKSGQLVIDVETDVRVQLSGNNLLLLASVAFTLMNGTRGDSGVFNFLTAENTVSERTDHNAMVTLRFDPQLADATLHLVIFAENESLPIFQGLVVRPRLNSGVPDWLAGIFIVFLLTLSSLFSGLNLGLMALDRTTLKVLKECGSETEQRYSRVIEPLRKHGNFLLCTLLLGNVFVNSCLSVMLNQLIGTGLLAVVFSTFAIVIFGEIIPQAACSRYGLLVGAKTRYLTILFMALTGIISWPLSRVLDLILGKEIGTVYDRDKLQKLLEVTQMHTDIGNEEVNIVQGALRMRRTKAEDIMTPIEKVFMVPYDSILDFNTMNDIFQSGYSRIPVYDGDQSNVVSVMNLKDIVFIDPDDRVPLKAALKAFSGNRKSIVEGADTDYVNVLRNGAKVHVSQADLVLRVENDIPLDQLLKRFLEQHCHMSFVYRTDNSNPDRDPVIELIGLVTLEDLFEEIIQREILDENDVADRHGRTVKRRLIDLSDVNRPGPISISPSLQLAAYQFLSTSVVGLFDSSLVTKNSLMFLLKNRVVCELDYVEGNTKSPNYDEADDKNFLYRPGCPADYFALILQGQVDVCVGKEGMRFEAGPFSTFGEQTLHSVNEVLANHPSLELREQARLIKQLPKYLPDYKVRAKCDLQYVEIDRATYLALRRQFQAASIKPMATDSTWEDDSAENKETEKLLLKELEVARNPDGEAATPASESEAPENRHQDRGSVLIGKKTVAFKSEFKRSKRGSEDDEVRLSTTSRELHGWENPVTVTIEDNTTGSEDQIMHSAL